MSETTALVWFDRARQAIEQAARIDEVKTIRDQAEAMRLYCKQQREGLQMQNQCAEIKMRAEVRAGELLAAHPDIGPGKPSTLEGLGIAYTQSHRWQTMAQLPPAQREAHMATVKASGEELTSASLYREAKRYLHTQASAALRAHPIALPEGRYRTLVIDPPWPMDKIEREVRPHQAPVLDYPTMPVWCAYEWVSPDGHTRLPCFETGENGDETCPALECLVGHIVAEHAMQDGCHVYLWVTHKFLPDGLALLSRWNVTYQCLMTWGKHVGITPYSWMYDTEHVLFGRLGHLPLEQNGLRLLFEARAEGHSVKPAVFYDRVRCASPPPRLDVFARGTGHDGFTSWGADRHGDEAPDGFLSHPTRGTRSQR